MPNEPEPYLILHKVRGQPAFDIAHQIEIDDEECWIIPTSGHRAYPYWHALLDVSEYKAQESLYGSMNMPSDWPDHYTVNKSPTESKVDGKSLLASLGLPTQTHNSMTGKLTRRI